MDVIDNKEKTNYCCSIFPIIGPFSLCLPLFLIFFSIKLSFCISPLLKYFILSVLSLALAYKIDSNRRKIKKETNKERQKVITNKNRPTL